MIELPTWWWLGPIGAAAALGTAWILFRRLMACAPGDASVQRIAGLVRDGAFAYLRAQYRVAALVFVGLAVLLSIQAYGLKQHVVLAPTAFLLGGLLSALAGFLGMNTATRAASRTTWAVRESLNAGLTTSFQAGAVMGLVVVGLGLFQITLWFWGLVWLLPRWNPALTMSIAEITALMLYFGVGASVMALFARVGGGIFTKSADVGADLVGKMEAGLAEDDARNPAVIADNVGDNVGDVAGMGADLYESYCSSILASAALGAAAGQALRFSPDDQLALTAAPMALAGVGILVSIPAIFLVRAEGDTTGLGLLRALRRGSWSATGLFLIAAIAFCAFCLPAGIAWSAAIAVTAGLVAGLAIGWNSEYFTSSDYAPTRRLAEHAATGAGTLVIAGLAQGFLSVVGAIVSVGLATLIAFAATGGFTTPGAGLYGIGIAAVGMLATLGVTMASDAYGPVADNAGGLAEMSGQDPIVRLRTDALDALGNTTAATGKGFAIGSAALTALALLAALTQEIRFEIEREARAHPFAALSIADGAIREIGHGKFVGVEPNVTVPRARAYVLTNHGQPFQLDEGIARPVSGGEIAVGNTLAVSAARVVRLSPVNEIGAGDVMEFYRVTPMNPRMLVGLFAGALVVFVFCGQTMRAVGRAAGAIVEEVRRQLRDRHLLTDSSAQPDSAACVSIATSASLREMLAPALLVIGAPLFLGLTLGVSGLMGLLAGSVATGFAMAVFMANAGGAWDNAKKFIEAGHLGGKGSEAHKASVIGDTVGDPFKDTSGPSLNILIKLMSMAALVSAGLVVRYAPSISAMIGLGG